MAPSPTPPRTPPPTTRPTPPHAGRGPRPGGGARGGGESDWVPLALPDDALAVQLVLVDPTDAALVVVAALEGPDGRRPVDPDAPVPPDVLLGPFPAAAASPNPSVAYASGVGGLLVPNTPRVALGGGAWRLRLAAVDAFTEAPLDGEVEVTAFIRRGLALPDRGRLPVRVYCTGAAGWTAAAPRPIPISKRPSRAPPTCSGPPESPWRSWASRMWTGPRSWRRRGRRQRSPPPLPAARRPRRGRPLPGRPPRCALRHRRRRGGRGPAGAAHPGGHHAQRGGGVRGHRPVAGRHGPGHRP
ncbi:MAG: hypothetical protein R3F60_12865 [bacterium]